METTSTAIAKAKAYFEHLSVTDVDRMQDIYSPDAYFKDPFNEVNGVEAIRNIFGHMFVKVEKPRFVIQTVVAGHAEAFMTWDFYLRFKGEQTERKIHGATHFRFSADGRIAYHRDYWDAAEELYEKLPFVGAMMRFLKRQANK
jgi:steroid Delta-isomerase